jgi:catechol 2,3-dioxygenase-like lactoylglutathione lyase family enzyme
MTATRAWRVLGIGWVGAGTDRYTAMRDFVVETLGLTPVLERDDFLVADAGDGDRFEVFGPASDAPPWQFSSGPVMVGFLVDDIHAARADLERAPGVELLGDLQVHGDGAWQHFRAPDGTVFELTWNERLSAR